MFFKCSNTWHYDFWKVITHNHRKSHVLCIRGSRNGRNLLNENHVTHKNQMLISILKRFYCASADVQRKNGVRFDSKHSIVVKLFSSF